MDGNMAGMKVNGCFILGLRAIIEKQCKQQLTMQKINAKHSSVLPSYALPRDRIFRMGRRRGMLSHKEWSKWLTPEGYHSTPLSLPDTTSAELLDLCDNARKQFYLNPKFLFKMLGQSIKSPKEFQRMLIAGKTFFPLLFSYIFRGKKTT